MFQHVNKKALLLRELTFLIVSIVYYHTIFFNIFSSSSLEIAYFKTYSIGIPTNYLSIWGYIDVFFKLRLYSAFFLQKIVSLLLLFNSSYLLVDLLYQRVRSSEENDKFDFLIKVILSLLLSLNGLFVLFFPIFGFSYLAFMNFSLFFSLKVILTNKNKMNMILYLMAASFFLAYGVILFPLILAFYGAVYLFIGAPIAISLRKKARFFYVIPAQLSIFALIYPSFIGLLIASKGSGSTLNSLSIIHPTNLVYYPGNVISTKSIGIIYSITGLNSLYYDNSLKIAALLVLCIIILSAFLIRHDFRGPLKGMIISFIVIMIVNLTFNGQSFVMFLVKYLVENHILRFNYYGIVLTVTTGNALVLVSYWYVLIALLTIYFGRKDLESHKSGRMQNKLLKSVTRFLAASQFIAIVIVLIILFQIGSTTTVSLDDAASWNYVQNSALPDYNQYLLFQNSTYWGNQYVFPPNYEIEPLGNKFPFNEAVFNAQNSPYLTSIDNSFPASSIVLGSTSHSQYLYNATPVGSEYLIKNFNGSNVIAGSPIFVVGSASSFESFFSSTATKPIPSSSKVVTMHSVSNGMNDSIIPAYDLGLLKKGDFLSFAFNVSLPSNNINPNVGGFNFGIDSNFSNRGGYGLNNNFTGIGTNYGNRSFSQAFSSYSGFQQNFTGWTIDFSWTNSSIWNEPLWYTHFGKDLHLHFRIVEAKVFDNYYIYMDIFGKWYSVSACNLFPSEYLTMYNYNEPTRNISMSVNITAFTVIKNSSSLLPIFYDSPFSSESTLIEALNSSSAIVFGKGYNIQDLWFSYLILHNGVNMTEPSAYAIDLPQNGWFQTFPSNPPQGAYYSENINPSLLPINIGYGPGIGYAEDILANSKLTIQLSQNVNDNDMVGINLLFSPMGGPLNVAMGNHTTTIDTFSNESFYKWISLNDTVDTKTITFQNGFGVQSINLIVSLPKSLMTSAKIAINSILNHKPEIFLGGGYIEHLDSMTVNISGIFNGNSCTNTIEATTGQSTIMLLLPTEYSSAFSISAKNATFAEVPVWGYFLGVVLTEHSGDKIIVTLRNSSFYSGVIIYSPLILSGVIIIINPFIMKRRKKV